jgi:hypothetical protein
MLDISDKDLKILLDDIYNAPLNITEEMIIERLIDRYRWPQFYNTGAPTLERIVGADGLKVQDFFWHDGHVQVEKLLDFYDQGYTIIISGTQFLFKDITNITHRLYQQFGKEINSNCYLSKGTQVVSYPKHNHDYSVIVKNIIGKSTWEINKTEYQLENQDVFLIGKFIDHQVKQIDGMKFSITFNLQ